MMAAAANKPVSGALSDAQLADMKSRYRGVLVISTVCVFTAFFGIYSKFTLHQVWGLPLFAIAMVIGFGAQVRFIVGVVKASRAGKGS